MMIDPKDLIGIIQSIVTWTCFFIALAIFKRFFTYGLSVAFTELLKIQSEESRKKMARWFGNGDDILDYLNDLDQKKGSVDGRLTARMKGGD